MKNYRIGELSKYLDVTPDFIKYYEKEGLITSIPETSPKLYPFNQSSKILECIKLKNLGFTAKEMQDYLFSDTLKDYRETKQELDYETRKNISFIKEIDDYQRWIKTYKNDPLPFSLETVDSFYFLKHTSFTDFIHDENIYQIISSWTKLMPVVKSAVHLKIENSQITERTWGLLITKQNAENFSIPVNEACTLIPEQKTLQHHLINSEMGKEKEEKIYSQIINETDKTKLKLSGEIFGIVLSGTATKRSTKTLFLLKP